MNNCPWCSILSSVSAQHCRDLSVEIFYPRPWWGFDRHTVWSTIFQMGFNPERLEIRDPPGSIFRAEMFSLVFWLFFFKSCSCRQLNQIWKWKHCRGCKSEIKAETARNTLRIRQHLWNEDVSGRQLPKTFWQWVLDLNLLTLLLSTDAV